MGSCRGMPLKQRGLTRRRLHDTMAQRLLPNLVIKPPDFHHQTINSTHRAKIDPIDTNRVKM